MWEQKIYYKPEVAMLPENVSRTKITAHPVGFGLLQKDFPAADFQARGDEALYTHGRREQD